MKNRQSPANAQEWFLWGNKIGECPTLGAGLTKREYAAIHLNTDDLPITTLRQVSEFLGREVNVNDLEDIVRAQAEAFSKYRRMYADALFSELEKE